jgi:hypothetical protein
VGDELGDDRYLNHPGFDRQFILLDLAQKEAPLLNAEFSTSRDVLRRFIEGNEAELFALTARDAVAGELVNSVYAADSPARLLDIRKVRVEADTTQGTVRTAETARGPHRAVQDRAEGWWDEKAHRRDDRARGQDGDLTRKPRAAQGHELRAGRLLDLAFRRRLRVPRRGAPRGDRGRRQGGPGRPSVAEVLDLSDRTGIARFLGRQRLAQPVVTDRGPEVAAVLRQKMDFIVADLAGTEGLLREGMTRRDLGPLARRMAGRLPKEWEGLAALVAWAEEGRAGRASPRTTRPTSTRCAPRRGGRGAGQPAPGGADALDVRQLFICHKELFYRLYRTWPEGKKALVADLLATEYMVDKAGTREALFGPEPGMHEPAPAPGARAAWRPSGGTTPWTRSGPGGRWGGGADGVRPAAVPLPPAPDRRPPRRPRLAAAAREAQARRGMGGGGADRATGRASWPTGWRTTTAR